MASRMTRAVTAALLATLLVSPLAAHAEPSDHLSKAEHKVLERLTQQSGGTIQVTWDDKRGTPRYLSGKLSKPLKGEPLDMAFEFLDSVKDLYHFDKAKKSFRLKRVDQDDLGMKHVRLTHIVNNIPVWGDEIIVHLDKQNVVRSVNGEFTPNMEQFAERLEKPNINANQAIGRALEVLKIDKPSAPPTAYLTYFPYPDPDTVTLVYLVTVKDAAAPADWKVFIDTVTGDVLHKYNDIKFRKSTATKPSQQQ